MHNFPVWLKDRIDEKNISSAHLSRELQVSKSTISLWLQGKRQPDSSKIKIIVDYFYSSKAKKRSALFSIFYGK